MAAEPVIVSQEALLLSQSAFLAHISPAHLQRLVPHLRRRTYARGEVIYHRGDLPGDAYFVSNGMVKGRVESEDGRELIYAVWSRGESFGIYDIYHQLRRPVDMVALEPSEVFAVAASVFTDFLACDPAWLATAFINYTRKVRTQFERLQDIVFLPGRERLCKAIAQYAVDITEEDHRTRVLKKPLSQSQLAAFTGNSRESVNRWLKALARQGIIRLDRDGIVVLKPDVLRRQYPNFE